MSFVFFFASFFPQDYLELHVVSEGPHDLDDLLRQLAGGREHEGLALQQRHVDLLKDGHGESRGLTGTYLDICSEAGGRKKRGLKRGKKYLKIERKKEGEKIFYKGMNLRMEEKERRKWAVSREIMYSQSCLGVCATVVGRYVKTREYFKKARVLRRDLQMRQGRRDDDRRRENRFKN